MPTATRAQIQAQIDTLSKQLEGADTDDEVWIEDESGHKVRVTGRKATSILERYRTLWDAPAEGEDDPEPADDPEPGGGGLFKKRGAKPTAAPPA